MNTDNRSTWSFLSFLNAGFVFAFFKWFVTTSLITSISF